MNFKENLQKIERLNITLILAGRHPDASKKTSKED